MASKPLRVKELDQFEQVRPMDTSARRTVPIRTMDAPSVKVDALEPLPLSALARVVIAQGTDPDDASRF